MAHIVYQQFPEQDYTLIKRTSSFQPWVLCYMYDSKTGTWAQGHYFSTLYQVEAYLNAQSERYYNDRYSYKVNEFEAVYFEDDPEPYEEYYYQLIDTFDNEETCSIDDWSMNLHCDSYGTCGGRNCPLFFSCSASC